jgi:hypothetical protein
MAGHKARQPLSRRQAIATAAAASVASAAQPCAASPRQRRGGAVALAAVQTAGGDLDAALALLDNVQTYGGHKDICVFPALALPGDALPRLQRAARHYDCTLVFGTRAAAGERLRLATTVTPTGEVRVTHVAAHDVSTFVLRTEAGSFRAVACDSDAWRGADGGIATAIHGPDGSVLAATRSRGEQAVVAVIRGEQTVLLES